MSVDVSDIAKYRLESIGCPLTLNYLGVLMGLLIRTEKFKI